MLKKNEKVMNEYVKKEFIHQREKDVTLYDGLLWRIFEKAKPFEDELAKDLCNFSYYEIKNMYKTWSMTSLETLLNINSQLINYTNYCLRRNLVIDCQNHFGEFNVDSLMTCINKAAKLNRVISRKELLDYFNKFDNYTDRFTMLAFFEGFSGQNHTDIIYAKLSDFDMDKKVFVTHDKREIQISDTLYNYAVEANDETEYIGVNNRRVSKQLEASPYIVKYSVNTRRNNNDDYQKGRIIYTRCYKLFNRIFDNPTFTIKDLKISGEIEHIQKNSQLKHLSVYAYMFSNYLKETNYQYNDNIVRSTFYKKYSDIFENPDFLMDINGTNVLIETK